jgi:glutamate synthase (NADPH/NADH) small chain
MTESGVPTLSADKRSKNFLEVSSGFNKKQALEEAMRCPQPAHIDFLHGCPLGVDILSFVRLIREGNPVAALEKIREKNPLAGICGRVCPAPCEQDPLLQRENRHVNVRALERYAADFGEHKKTQSVLDEAKIKIALVGSGPAGLTAAADLARLGYKVTVFEAMHVLGGVLRYALPEFRLPKKILDNEIEYLKSLGVDFRIGLFIGQTLTLAELFGQGYQAIYLAPGAGMPKTSLIAGSASKGVYTAGEFLMRFHKDNEALLSSLGSRIVVVGNKNDTLDCARISLRLKKKITLIHEGTEDVLSLRPEEIQQAQEEGLKLEVLVKPVEILSENNKIKGVKCVRMDFADRDSTGQWQLIAVEDSDFVIEADNVIISAGYKSNSLIGKFTQELKTNKDGTIWTDKNTFMTSIPGVFLAGAVMSPEATLVESMSLAKKAAEEMDKFLKARLESLKS